MKPADFQTSIRNSWDIVDSLKLGLTFSCPVSLRIDEAFRDLCLAEDPSYLEIYLKGLSLSYYNFALSDQSYFHFGRDSESDLRYAFYPNPFAAGRPRELARFSELRSQVESGDISYEDYLAHLHDAHAEGKIPPIRYENSPGQYKRLAHPCSHFHIGHHSDNRWAVRRVLTPLAFTLLVVKHYYGGSWQEHGSDRQSPFGNILEEELTNEKRDNCRIIPDNLFAKEEALTFHFF